jgi:hypothetical protein
LNEQVPLQDLRTMDTNQPAQSNPPAGACLTDPSYHEPFAQQAHENQQSYLTEEELAAQNAFLGNYNFDQTPDAGYLNAHITNEWDMVYQNPLPDTMQTSHLDANNQADSHEVTSQAQNLYSVNVDTVPHQQAFAPFPANQIMGSVASGSHPQNVENIFYNTYQIQGGATDNTDNASNQPINQVVRAVNYGIPSTMAGPKYETHDQVTMIPDSEFTATKKEPEDGLDVTELISMAQEYTKHEPERTQTPSSDNVLTGRVTRSSTATSSKTSTKAKAGRKTKSSTQPKGKRIPTAMQCAPISIPRDRNGKQRVEIGPTSAGDGLPEIKVLPVSDDDDKVNPLALAEAVARPRDEQLTLPRPGVPLSGPRVKVPYLTIDDTMTKEEQLRRAAHNQKISEVDRADRRARNNESARRNRERTKQAIIDAQAQAEVSQARVKQLEEQLAEREAEIAGLRSQLESR